MIMNDGADLMLTMMIFFTALFRDWLDCPVFGSFCDAFVSLVNNSTVQSLLYSVQ